MNNTLRIECGEYIHDLIVKEFPVITDETTVMVERCPKELQDILTFLQPEGVETEYFTSFLGETTWRVTYVEDNDTVVALYLYDKWDVDSPGDPD